MRKKSAAIKVSETNKKRRPDNNKARESSVIEIVLI